MGAIGVSSNQALRPLIAVTLVLAVITSATSPRPAQGHEEPTPLESLISRKPAQVMKWEGDNIAVRAGKLPEDELPIAEELVAGLNEAHRVGHVVVARNFAVTATEAGIDDLTEWMETTTYGCTELENITVDWRGFRADAEPTCTDEEFEERRRAAEGPQAEDDGVVMPMHHTNPGGIQVSENLNCFLSVVGLAAATVAVLALMANPVTGFFAWVAWSFTGGVAFGAWTGFVLNCTGVRAVRQRVRTASGNRDYHCHFHYYSDYVWSSRANNYVPRSVRYYC